MTDERSECIVLGRVIGSYNGWDQVDDSTICFYGFEPILELSHIPSGDLGFNYEEGKFESYADNGEIIFESDAVEELVEAGVRRKYKIHAS